MTALIRVLLTPGETKAFGFLFLFSFKFFIRLAAVLPLLFIHANSVPGFQNTSNIGNTPKLSVIDESIHIAITPYINRIRVAGTAEFAGFNDEVHPKRVNYLNSKLNEVYPNIYSKIKDDEEAEMWFGFRPMSADGRAEKRDAELCLRAWEAG